MTLTNRVPCELCPFSRKCPPGATGGADPCRYVGQAIGPWWLPCHMAPDYEKNKLASNNIEVIPQCAGAAMYRANVDVARLLPDTLLKAAANTELVFATHAELLAHHLQIPLYQAEKLLASTTPTMMMATEFERATGKHLRLVPKDRKPK